MNALGDIPGEPLKRERARIVPPLVLIGALCLFAWVVVQFVINRPAERLARAGRALDAFAAIKPNKIVTVEWLASSELVADGPAAPNTLSVYLNPTHVEFILARARDGLGLARPYPRRVGVLRFDNHWNFAGGENEVTGAHYAAAETTGTR